MSTRTGAICLVSFSLLKLSCGSPFSEVLSGRSSSNVKPRSAIIESPGSNKSYMPRSFVIFQSENLPACKSLTNVVAPFGDIPTKTFTVLCVYMMKMLKIDFYRMLASL